MNTQPNRISLVEPSSFHLRERYFWQSRAMLRDPPQLTDLHSLARQIRMQTQSQNRPNASVSSESTQLRG